MKKIVILSLILGFVFGFSGKVYCQQTQGVKLVMMLHPVDILVKTKHSGEYHVMFSQGYVIITNAEIFDKVSRHIPEEANSGKYAVLEGYRIDINKLFSRKQLKRVSKQAGRDLSVTKAFIINGYALFDGTPPPTKNDPGW